MDSSDSSDDNGDTNNMTHTLHTDGVPMLVWAQVCLFVSKNNS